MNFMEAIAKLANGFSRRLMWLDRFGQAPISIVFLVTLPLLLIALSVWEGSYSHDAHHWGLMMSNAKDLIEGKTPYQEIFIQYGILTTIIQGAAYAYIGDNLRTLIGVTSFFYAAGLIGIYFLSLRVSNDKKLALFAFITAFLLHPVTILPWSNYIAFPFLAFGGWLLLDSKNRAGSVLFGAVLLSFAVLCREGLFPAVAVFSIVFSCINILTGKHSIRTLLLYWAGLLLPLTLFFAYLLHTNLLAYWYTTGVLLPQMYKDTMMPHGVIGAIGKLSLFFLKGFAIVNPRIILYTLILASSTYFVIQFIKSKNSNQPSAQQFLVAILALLLLSATLHLNEIFRLATGVTIGIVLLFQLARQYRQENIVFSIAALALIASFCYGGLKNYFIPLPFDMAGNGNYNAPDQIEITQSVEVTYPTLFKGQKWPVNIDLFYKSIQKDMQDLYTSDCGIKFFQNTSYDAFIAAMSPFRQFQLAPFFNPPSWANLRPDLNVDKKIVADKDIVLFLQLARTSAEAFKLPAGYVEARRYTMPKRKFNDSDDFLLLVAVPDRCASFVAQ